MLRIHTDELRQRVADLRVGDEILLDGTLYTARDAVHKRFAALMAEGNPLPLPLADAILYYAGPTPEKNGLAVGSCGPTTSSRMDPYTPALHDCGLCATIGKGERSEEVRRAIMRNGALYLCAIGGAGALYASCIKSCEVVAFEALGCESLKRMRVENMPLIVGIDCHGGNIFDRGST